MRLPYCFSDWNVSTRSVRPKVASAKVVRPVFCWAKAVDVLGLELCCPRCSRLFSICEVCFRQHRYCGPECRDQAREESKDKARIKYAKSEAGQESGRKRQKSFRIRHPIQKPKKTVTDHPTAAVSDSINPHYCLFCGVKIGRLFRCPRKFRQFLRRDRGDHGRSRAKGTVPQRC